MRFKGNPPWILVLIGPIIVAILFASIFVFGETQKMDSSGEELIIVGAVIWTTIPFLVLKLVAVRSILSWISAFLLMAGFYAFAVYDAASRANEKSGPNIGLGLLFIVLPFLVSGVCLAINRLTFRYEAHDSEIK